MRSFRDDSAVSEVIADLMLLSVTVLLAAVVAASVFSLVGSVQQTTISGVTAARTGTGVITVTYYGGEEMNSLYSLNITVNGSDYGTKQVYLNAATTPLDIANATRLRAPLPGRDHVVVVGNFADGRQQVLLNTFI